MADDIAVPHVTLDGLVDGLKLAGLEIEGPNQNMLVRSAIEQAFLSHWNQRRYSKASRLEEHTWPVALSVIEHETMQGNSASPELVAAALLHDVLDYDARITAGQFRAKFGETVYGIVEPLIDQYLAEPVERPRLETKAKKLNNRDSTIIFLASGENNLQSLPAHPYVEDGQQIMEMAIQLGAAQNFLLPVAMTYSKDFFYERIVALLEHYSKNPAFGMLGYDFRRTP